MSSKFNVDERDVRFMTGIAKKWWNEKGVWKSLHDMNEIRVKYVIEGLVANGKINADRLDANDALSGIKILDVGCGGGILTEALGKRQAEVVGLEPVEVLIEVANEHLKITSASHPINVQYICDTIEEHCKTHENYYDAVVCSEVVEHVELKESLLRACTKALKPGGSFFLTTLSKTIACWFIAWLWGEWILGIIPRGNHNFFWFITPKKLLQILTKVGCKTIHKSGMRYEIPWSRWKYWSYDGINYLLHAVKE